LLIRGGDVLERTHSLDTVVFDKTGTLTVGRPTVKRVVVAEGMNEVGLYKLNPVDPSRLKAPGSNPRKPIK
jgi:cation transport ATPase